MTPKQLDALQALCDAATEGEWVPYSDGEIIGTEYESDGSESSIRVAIADEEQDAEFIAAARTAMPRLIARVRELEAAHAQLEYSLTDIDGVDLDGMTPQQLEAWNRLWRANVRAVRAR